MSDNQADNLSVKSPALEGELVERPCRVFWGSHGCDLSRGHAGHHDCGCCECDDHERDHEAEGCVGKYPYYGPITSFYGEDAVTTAASPDRKPSTTSKNAPTEAQKGAL